MSEARRLGRGLEALLGPVSKEQAEKEGALRELPVTAIRPNPFQPRTRVDEEPLKELVFGEQPDEGMFTGLWSKVKLFCTTYDPANDRYRLDYSLFIGMFIGFLIIALGVFYLVRELRRGRAS